MYVILLLCDNVCCMSDSLSTLVLLNIKLGWWECMCYVLIFVWNIFIKKNNLFLWKNLKTGMHNLWGHWQLGPDVSMRRSLFEQSWSLGFQFEFKICFKFKVCITKGKMFWCFDSCTPLFQVSFLLLEPHAAFSVFDCLWL